MIASFIGVVFDGVAYGSLLFIISVGLSVTLGLMNFINLAHGAFGMLGGYVSVSLMHALGVPFLATVPVAFLVAAGVGALLEGTLLRRFYSSSHLDQVLLTIGLTFMAMAATIYVWGSSPQPVSLPKALEGQVAILGLEVGAYRLFLIGVVAAITAVLVWFVTRTRAGAMIRASVDNPQAAAGLGINVKRVFASTFALGSGLAGLGGALGIPVLGLDAGFALKFLVYILVVVTVGGAGTMSGPLVAAIVLGVLDTLGKYYVPQIGGFVIYAAMIVLLLAFPGGLRRGGAGRGGAHATPAMVQAVSFRPSTDTGLPDGRLRPIEIALWAGLLIIVPIVAPGYLALANQIAITAIFAVSLDLVLGYAGIVSLGHAAPFGIGAYAAGLLAKYGWGEPISGLLVASAAGALVGYGSTFLLRGSDITRLMVTLGIGLMLFEAANRAVWLTGGADGLGDVAMWKLLGHFEFDLEGRTAFYYSLVVLIIVMLFARRLVSSPLGLALRGIRERPARMPALGSPVRNRLATIYVISCAIAGVAGGLLAQTTQFVGTDTLGFLRSADLVTLLVLGGVGWLYGGLVGAVVFIVAQDFLSSLNPAYWHFWLGLLLVLVVLLAKGGIGGGVAALTSKRKERSA